MGQLNRHALLRRLQKLGAASRADLAKSLGLSQPTAGKIVDELLAAGVLEEFEVPEAGPGESAVRGRPGRRLQLSRSRPRLLAIQLGLEETVVAGLPLGADDAGNPHFTFPTGRHASRPAGAWEKHLGAVLRKLRRSGYFGALLSVPGIVDETANRILYSPNLHWTEQADIAAMVRRVWKLPVLLVQEERALALGHHLANPDWEDFLLVDFGEGVGGAVIIGGKPLASPLPISGEIGHTPAPGNTRPCGCGAVGCVETLLSQRGLLESFSAVGPGSRPTMAALQKYISKNGVPAWLAQSLDAAAAAIAGVLNVLGLRRVVITGCLGELPPPVFAHLSQSVQNGALWARFGSVECVSAPRRRMPGIVAVGIDRLVVPDVPENVIVPVKPIVASRRNPTNITSHPAE